MEALPYDVLIDSTGIWYGPAGTEPKSRDWQWWHCTIGEFFAIVCRPEFILNVSVWKVRA